eukprot:4913971-Pleurochrysis_carterae.AAC.4
MVTCSCACTIIILVAAIVGDDGPATRKAAALKYALAAARPSGRDRPAATRARGLEGDDAGAPSQLQRFRGVSLRLRWDLFLYSRLVL